MVRSPVFMNSAVVFETVIVSTKWPLKNLHIPELFYGASNTNRFSLQSLRVS